MKKLLALALALIMVVSLAACGGGGGEETPVAGEIHGISPEEYAQMTTDTLIAELIKDSAAPTVEEYAALIDTIGFVEVYENCTFADNITEDAIAQLKDNDAALPNIMDCYTAVLANEDAKVRGFYYQQLYNQLFGKDTAYYEPILTKILTETEAVAVSNILRYLSSNYRQDQRFCDFALTFKDSESAAVRKQFATAVVYLMPEDKEPFIQATLKLLEDSDADVRSTAALNCGNFEDDRFVEPLVKILKDESLESLHANAVDALVDMWFDYPIHDSYSEKAYKATMDYYKGEYSSEDLPNWQAVNKIALKGSTNFTKWEEKAEYFDADEIIGIMTKLFNDNSKDKLIRSQCIAVIGNFGDKADLEALQGTIDKIEDDATKTSLQSKLDSELAKK